MAERIRIKPVLEWRDLWVGVFLDTAKHRIYVLPLPCVGVVIDWSGEQNSQCSSPTQDGRRR